MLAEIARMRLCDIKVAASSLFPVHAPLVEHIRRGVVTGISTCNYPHLSLSDQCFAGFPQKGCRPPVLSPLKSLHFE